jgi:pteridine reductase
MSKPTALVTGGSRRIGAEICRELHREKMDVIIHYNTSSADALELQKNLNTDRPDSAYVLQGDLCLVDNCVSLIERAFRINKRLDVLINNASAFYPTPIKTISESQWEELIGVNLKAPLFLSRDAAPYLSKTGGSIINLIDIYADYPLREYIIYSISKNGLVTLTQSLAKELGPEIRVNGISPGAILWPDNMPEEDKKAILARTILKRQGEVTEITRAVRYLVMDATYTTGQILTIDGGRTLFF